MAAFVRTHFPCQRRLTVVGSLMKENNKFITSNNKSCAYLNCCLYCDTFVSKNSSKSKSTTQKQDCRKLRNPRVRKKIGTELGKLSFCHGQPVLGSSLSFHRFGIVPSFTNQKAYFGSDEASSAQSLAGNSSDAAEDGDSDGEEEGDNVEESDIEEDISISSTTLMYPMNDLTPVITPEVLPEVPLIVISRTPLFPNFIKQIVISDQRLIETIVRHVMLKLPYAGVFLKKDESSESDVVESVSDVHKTGSFVQITEMQRFEDKLRMTVKSLRRISIIKRLREPDLVEDLETVIGQRDNNLRHGMLTVFKRLTRKERRERRIKQDTTESSHAENTSDKNGHGMLTVFKRLTRKERRERRIKQGTTESSHAENTSEKNVAMLKTHAPFRVLRVETENVQYEPYTRTDEIKAVSAEVLQTIRDIIAMTPDYSEQIDLDELEENEDHAFLSDLAATMSTAEPGEIQKIMEERNVPERLSLALTLVKRELAISKLREKMCREVEDEMKKPALHQFMKSTKAALGPQKDDTEALEKKFRDRLQDLVVPEHVRTVIDEEISSLGSQPPFSQGYNKTINYLDWLTIIPWGKYSKENLDVKQAKEILEEEHYGMGDAKNRILEFIATSQLKGSSQGKILCFHGPPGVGKTSIAKSIAKALNREYFRFSVGGMADVAEIKGHRRTYVGAMPGKIIQCLKKTKTENPLVLIDEIDKMSRNHTGDPASALLEMLDPEQNSNFLDDFMDVTVDLSKVLFICTANTVDGIPGPLIDRMELIELSGYVAEEKLAIAQKYLVPQAMEYSGIKPDQVRISEEAMSELIKSYCRESGVRSLQKYVEKIYRKIALKILSENISDIVVDHNNLQEFVGKPLFTKERMYDITPPGVVTGLAWTAMGGSTLYIETVLKKAVDPESKDSGDLEVTGKLGDVMKESIQLAHTFAKSYLNKINPDNQVLEKADLHIHVPEGATPKDGPSAGCTVVTALLSLGLNKPCRQDLAMTGEVSLTGKVLPIGGVKEKVMAAKRSGFECVIFPEDNRGDIAELQDFITRGLEVHFVNTYSDVFKVAFPDITPPS